MADTTDDLVTIYLLEYEKLKDEQIARIGFRDNLVYATLVAIGGVISFALSGSTTYRAILVLPLATFVLGWIYLNNDRKISSIGQYIRTILAQRLRQSFSSSQLRPFEWEMMYRLERRRAERKILQLFVHESLFVGSGAAAIVIFLTTTTTISRIAYWIAGVELFALGVLAVEFAIYADFRFKRQQR